MYVVSLVYVGSIIEGSKVDVDLRVVKLIANSKQGAIEDAKKQIDEHDPQEGELSNVVAIKV